MLFNVVQPVDISFTFDNIMFIHITGTSMITLQMTDMQIPGASE